MNPIIPSNIIQPLINLSVAGNAVDTQWQDIINIRNMYLASTDWTVSNDSPLSPSKIEEYKAYRQALRDIPQDFAKPEDVIWPTKPE